MSDRSSAAASYFSEIDNDPFKCGYVSNINFYRCPGSVYSYNGKCFRKSETKSSIEENIFATKSDEAIHEKVEVQPNQIRMDRPWGTYNIYPELYQDEVAPVVQIKGYDQLVLTKDEAAGVLSVRIIATRMNYIAKNPITGALVLIKVELNALNLKNIYILRRYRFIQYLDISKNYLNSLEVLNFMPYLQFLKASYNQFSDLLKYDNAQWFLTEVHFKYNVVTAIRDLKPFWSLTILDLSHNNIKAIKGLQELKFLRRLDLSFNNIRRLENLNNLRLIWLDLSYNRISECEYTSTKGLWTLHHLEFLNINDNMIKSLKVLGRCYRLRELHIRNNGISYELDMAVYLRHLLKLHVLDLRENPICTTDLYPLITLITFPKLLYMDGAEVDYVEQATAKLENKVDIMTYTNRRLLSLLALQQLSLPRVGPDVPAADARDPPLIVLTGPPATAKGTLCRRLAEEYPNKVFNALLHTTALCRSEDREAPLYHHITAHKFKEMLIAGNFLSYFEYEGDSYGLCRLEVAKSILETPPSSAPRMCITRMGQVGALLLRARGLRPHLILTMREDEALHTSMVQERATPAFYENSKDDFANMSSDFSILRDRLSARIYIGGILQEVLMKINDERMQSDFIVESDYTLTGETEMLDDEVGESNEYFSLHSLYKYSETGTRSLSEYIPTGKQMSYKAEPVMSKMDTSAAITSGQPRQTEAVDRSEGNKPAQHSALRVKKKYVSSGDNSKSKSVDFGNNWKGTMDTNALSSKIPANYSKRSVSFQEESLEDIFFVPNEPENRNPVTDLAKSISKRIPLKHSSNSSIDDLDYWIDFATDVGIARISDSSIEPVSPHISVQHTHSLQYTQEEKMEKAHNDGVSCWCNLSAELYHKYPGVFSDIIVVDDIEAAYKKLKKIVKTLAKEQGVMEPLYDIDFSQMNLASINHRLDKIQKEIAPCRMTRHW